MQFSNLRGDLFEHEFHECIWIGSWYVWMWIEYIYRDFPAWYCVCHLICSLFLEVGHSSVFMPWLSRTIQFFSLVRLNSFFSLVRLNSFSLVQLNNSNFPVSLPMDMTVVFLRYEQCFSRDCRCFPEKMCSAMVEAVSDNWQMILRPWPFLKTSCWENQSGFCQVGNCCATWKEIFCCFSVCIFYDDLTGSGVFSLSQFHGCFADFQRDFYFYFVSVRQRCSLFSRFLITPPPRLYLRTGRRTDKGLWVNCQLSSHLHCRRRHLDRVFTAVQGLPGVLFAWFTALSWTMLGFEGCGAEAWMWVQHLNSSVIIYCWFI